MAKSDRKREVTRGGRSGTRRQTFLTNRPAGEKLPADMHRWPVGRAYVPDPDVWRVSGCGFVGVLRRRPDGKLATAYFQIELNGGGIVSMSGKLDADPAAEENDLRTYAPHVPAFREGPVDLVARYLRG